MTAPDAFHPAPSRHGTVRGTDLEHLYYTITNHPNILFIVLFQILWHSDSCTTLELALDLEALVLDEGVDTTDLESNCTEFTDLSELEDFE